MKKREKNTSVFEKIHNFVYGNFTAAINYTKELKNYFWIVFGLFFIAGVIGFIFPGIFEKQILEIIKQLLEQTEGLGTIDLMGFIIMNNIKSAFFGLFLGVFFGLFSLMVAIVNAYVLGFVMNKTILIENVFVLWRLFPHGIFEIPAIILSLAAGLKLGLFMIFSKNKTWNEFVEWSKNSLRVFVFIIIPLLVIAGIIEGILIGVLG